MLVWDPLLRADPSSPVVHLCIIEAEGKVTAWPFLQLPDVLVWGWLSQLDQFQCAVAT